MRGNHDLIHMYEVFHSNSGSREASYINPDNEKSSIAPRNLDVPIVFLTLLRFPSSILLRSLS